MARIQYRIYSIIEGEHLELEKASPYFELEQV